MQTAKPKTDLEETGQVGMGPTPLKSSLPSLGSTSDDVAP